MAAAWLFFTGCRVSEACRARQHDVRWLKEAGFYQWSIDETKTHTPRIVWLPPALAEYIEQSRRENNSKSTWPVLWDCSGRGFGRNEDPSHPISPRTINSALERAADACGFTTHVTAHVAKHTYCTNWLCDAGSDEIALEKLARQVGTSVGVLRSTYIHIDLSADDWAHLRDMGVSRGA
jgi:integrase